MVIQFKKIAAYFSYARLGLANSDRIVCQITSDAINHFIIILYFFDDQLLAVHKSDHLIE